MTRLMLQVNPEDAARLSALAKDVSGAETELMKLKKNAAGLMEQAEKLQGQIDNAGGSRMKKQKQAVLDLQQVHCLEIQGRDCLTSDDTGMVAANKQTG